MIPIQFAVVLPSQIYSTYRRVLANKAFRSLSLTRMPTLRPTVYVLIKGERDPESQITQGAYAGFDLEYIQEPGVDLGTESSLAFATDHAFASKEEFTHVVWMGDDSLFHPDWLLILENLIRRHPDARAWSVYRSAYEAVHQTLEQRDGDVRVKSLCGHGLTVSRKEWAEWGVRWQDGRGAWGSPSGNTLDMLHIHARPGERWCTAKSYVEHTGRSGKNCHPDIPEWAVDFQGFGAYDTVENLPWKKVFE